MKMMYGNAPFKGLKVKSFGVDTNDCTMVASDLQAGVTAVARGKKITGTGKSFEFAQYGRISLNFPIVIPANINVIELASTEYPVRMLYSVNNIKDIDFSSKQDIAKIIIDNEEYTISLVINNNMMTISCDKSISLEVFYGKDNYT